MREGYTLWQIAAMRFMQVWVVVAAVVASGANARADKPRELLDEAKALLVVGACADGTPPATVTAKTVEAHCKTIRKAQDAYKTGWVTPVREFFAAHVPATVPKIVVYPFAGGDLSTALTVYPDASEITTLSLEPAGDPRALSRMDDKQVRVALKTVEKELSSLYRSSYSKTMDMIGAMRGAQLPTQLIFSLSALTIHGYEPVAMRYFRLTTDGDIEYLSDADFAAIDKIEDVGKRNQQLSNVEIKFKKQGGTREQIYRHIMANLDDKHLKAEPNALVHLEKKGNVAAMTKAASYLLSFGEFQAMRKYIIDHVDWMVSDSTGLPPKYGTPAGFEYETYGSYEASNMKAGGEVTPQWVALYKQQPKRPLTFRFGYPDKKWRGHLILMGRAPKQK
ncbi:MAG TPA: hypothetical protein VFV99_07425 [Kofleriaceae bacterium]|nr:hypothetical protein [Kofleriaceae bacterium]